MYLSQSVHLVNIAQREQFRKIAQIFNNNLANYTLRSISMFCEKYRIQNDAMQQQSILRQSDGVRSPARLMLRRDNRAHALPLDISVNAP